MKCISETDREKERVCTGGRSCRTCAPYRDDPVRVIDEFVDGLDLKKLDFETAEPRPDYYP
jgi:hypothetical protein